jgi:HEAT repeat protein
MILDPISLDEAKSAVSREQAAFREWFLTSLDDDKVFSLLACELRQADWAVLLPELRQISRGIPTARALNASALLLEVGDATGTAGIVACLLRVDSPLCRAALHVLAQVSADLRRGSYRVPLDQEAVLAAIDPHFHSVASGVRRYAVDVLRHLDIEAAKDRMIGLLPHDDTELRIAAAVELARRGEDHGSLDVIETLLNSEPLDQHNRYLVLSGLRKLAEHGDARTRSRVASIAVSFVRQRLQSMDDDGSDGVEYCLDAISAASAVEATGVLAALLNSPQPAWVRAKAMRCLAELEGGRHGIDRLLAALADERLRDEAAQGLSALAWNTGDCATMDSLVRALDAAPDGPAWDPQQNRSALARAIVVVSDTQDLSRLAEQLQQVDPFIGMSAHWKVHSFDPTFVVNRLERAGVIRAPAADLLAKWESDWARTRDGRGVLLQILSSSENIWGIDRSGDFANLPGFMRELAKLAEGTVTIGDISEVPEVDVADNCRLRFVACGQAFSFSVENSLWHIDVVLMALNTALEMLGVPGRFFQFLSHDAHAVGFFAPPGPFLAIAQELQIPLEPLSSA